MAFKWFPVCISNLNFCLIILHKRRHFLWASDISMSKQYNVISSIQECFSYWNLIQNTENVASFDTSVIHIMQNFLPRVNSICNFLSKRRLLAFPNAFCLHVFVQHTCAPLDYSWVYNIWWGIPWKKHFIKCSKQTLIPKKLTVSKIWCSFQGYYC